MIKVKSEGFEEYWAPEYKCPYCNRLDMHESSKYCSGCGKSFKDVEWEDEE